MSATADIVLSDHSGVLLLPNRAIKYNIEGSPVVLVMVDGEPEGVKEIEERSVVIGISDGFRTEILSGLWEGEIVVVEAPAESEAPSGPGFPFGSPH